MRSLKKQGVFSAGFNMVRFSFIGTPLRAAVVPGSTGSRQSSRGRWNRRWWGLSAEIDAFPPVFAKGIFISREIVEGDFF
jgi:hypothetical protein